MTEKFKILGTCLDTTKIRFNPGTTNLEPDYTYIMTSLEANNDYMVGGLVKNNPGLPLIVCTEFLDNVRYALEEHLKLLGRDTIDLLLIGPNADYTKLEVIDQVKHLGLLNPPSVDFIKDKEFKVEFVALPISPLDFNMEIIKYCNENNIRIIGLNPMGGYLSAPRNIEAFSVPYLLGFCATYSEIVVVSGRDSSTAYTNAQYLKSLVGKEGSIIYNLKKSVHKPVPHIKKAVYTSAIMDGEDYVIPYSDPEFSVSLESHYLKLGSYLEKLGEPNVKISDDVKEVDNYLKVLYYPKDGTLADKFAIARYRVLDYLTSAFRDYTYNSVDDIAKIGDNVFLITLEKAPKFKGHFIWRHLEPGDTRQFYLILGMNGETLFKEVGKSNESLNDGDEKKEEEKVPNNEEKTNNNKKQEEV